MTATLITPSQIKPPGGCSSCQMRRRCKNERLWLNGPLPCEGLLDHEVGVEWERDSLRTLWVMPLVVRVNVEAM